jgi:poly-gamma-glutamate synthesis protein (capsule biosynthesis protein)
MTGRGIDQVLPRSCRPRLYEPFVSSALDYVALAERVNGPIPRPMAYTDLWGEAGAVLARTDPDARIINLETSITTSEDADPKGINYRMHPGNIEAVTAAGIDCCVLANNHVLDWGRTGLLETLRTLSDAGVRAAGAGRDLRTASAPAVLEMEGGGRVLVFAFGTSDSGIPDHWAAEAVRPGVYLLSDLSSKTVQRIIQLVGEIRQPGDLAIASLHWGPNWGFEIPAPHRWFAHALIDEASIDLVHGHSSHHPKAIEVYRDRLVLYGCGDFLNDYEGIRGYGEFRSDLVLMYFPTLDARTGRLIGLELVPLQIRRFRLQAPAAPDRAWLGRTLDREYRRFGHHLAGRGDGWVLE